MRWLVSFGSDDGPSHKPGSSADEVSYLFIIMEEGKCNECGAAASKKCAGCGSVFYCCIEC